MPREVRVANCGFGRYKGGALNERMSRLHQVVRRGWLALLVGVCVLPAAGCRTVSFYAQATRGQAQLITQRESIHSLLHDPGTPQVLRERLQLVYQLREFARGELHLPVDGHYEHYVDLKREHVVWNVQAAPEFSLVAKSWWYPFVGALDYRGYFSEAGARRYGEWLRKQGWDVHYAPASAYSTLGWFRDPVLNTFLFDPEPAVAEVLFHELAHQEVFLAGDTEFNEAFATTVGEEAARRWLRARGDKAAAAWYEVARARNREFVGIVLAARAELERLYGDDRDKHGRLRPRAGPHPLEAATLREQKEEVIARLRQRYGELKTSWGGAGGHDPWFGQPINNATLNSVATYYDLVPGFERLLVLNGGDLRVFYRQVEQARAMSREERHRWIRSLADEGG